MLETAPRSGRRSATQTTRHASIRSTRSTAATGAPLDDTRARAPLASPIARFILVVPVGRERERLGPGRGTEERRAHLGAGDHEFVQRGEQVAILDGDRAVGVLGREQRRLAEQLFHVCGAGAVQALDDVVALPGTELEPAGVELDQA